MVGVLVIFSHRVSDLSANLIITISIIVIEILAPTVTPSGPWDGEAKLPGNKR